MIIKRIVSLGQLGLIEIPMEIPDDLIERIEKECNAVVNDTFFPTNYSEDLKAMLRKFYLIENIAQHYVNVSMAQAKGQPKQD